MTSAPCRCTSAWAIVWTIGGREWRLLKVEPWTRIVIVKNEQGKLEGFSAEDERAYNRWRRLVQNMEIGETLEFDFTIPRSTKHHRAFFWKVRVLLERTEAFSTERDLRNWLTTGAGYVDMVPGPDGTPNAIPQSLEYAGMDEADFAELHRKVTEFLWTPHALEVLWPHHTERARKSAIDSFFYAVRQRDEQ
jgi:hypothetical protein